jgi:hypothetical protein
MPPVSKAGARRLMEGCADLTDDDKLRKTKKFTSTARRGLFQ